MGDLVQIGLKISGINDIKFAVLLHVAADQVKTALNDGVGKDFEVYQPFHKLDQGFYQELSLAVVHIRSDQVFEDTDQYVESPFGLFKGIIKP
ncbi:hypothetical protein SDC9_155622 [bioreactor metagenome]|uniref:Uncharacterized protein n=1 Tax=bioreactor metagenome TaxID=1076179 RepID=A0A645F3C6_9ZZZZ